MTLAGRMNFVSLSDLERDACLLEDVVTDLAVAWAQVREVPVTPRSTQRLTAVLGRLHGVADSNTAVRVEIHQFLQRVERERAK